MCFRSKMLPFEYVLLCFRSQMRKNPYKNLLIISFCISNLPNPLLYRCNFSPHQKQYCFSKNCSENAWHLGSPGFSEIFHFAVCGGVFCTFPYDRGSFVVIFLHFAKKYRCVPKIGFPADMFSHFPSCSSEVSLCT